MFQNQAACRPEDEHIMFSELGSKVARAKAICASCPVSKQCLTFALDYDIEYGIFGGHTAAERKALVNA